MPAPSAQHRSSEYSDHRITANGHADFSGPRPCRRSSDRFGLEAGVDRQLEDAEDTRARLRWGPFAKVYRENDTSAFKKRKVIKSDGTIDWIVLRPEFRQLLADLANDVIDGVIFYDLDRLVRQPRDLEDLIDIVEYVKRPVTGATGGRMNLINDSDRHMARMMCVMALKSSEDTARRIARQHLSAAQNGLAQGRIAYGWVRKGEHKGQLVPDEADIVIRIFQDFMTGESAYMCPPSDRGGCGGTAIAAQTADSAIEEAMTAFLRNQLQAAKSDHVESSDTITALQARLDQDLSRKSALIHRWSEGSLHEVGLTEEDYFTMLATLNRKISTHRESIATLEGAPAPTVAPDELLKN
ncbi:recombinase family protein [Streptomyces gilvosporeus]|uniref:Resolvase/invertase-type recombinase catalytic domain-containing protein n=1 Tax=Streptomyces gilvosporeus TaxID=553510 RepID=A0A1V0TJT2_9ACTN|nr:recombinase family protein [Streptomyces gilvosporeus]ARF53179.1 hypothetical protein B1H19_02415 [Streptomyces gilvosporeus]